MTTFKIRHIPTGKFSPGGYDGNKLNYLSDKGKTWSGLGPLRNHLNLCKYSDEFEIVECELIVINVIPMNEERMLVAKRKQERQEVYELRVAQYKLEQAELELARIKKQYPQLMK